MYLHCSYQCNLTSQKVCLSSVVYLQYFIKTIFWLPDICVLREAKSDVILECQAAEHIHANHTIALVNIFLCDGIRHCRYGEDETHTRCHKTSGE